MCQMFCGVLAGNRIEVCVFYLPTFKDDIVHIADVDTVILAPIGPACCHSAFDGE